MNADETAKAPSNGAFQPITPGSQPASGQQPTQPGQTPASGQQPVRRAGVLPNAGAAQASTSTPPSIPPAGSGAPATGTVPQRSAFRPTGSPASGAQPTVSRPASIQPGTQAAQPARTPTSGAFATTGASGATAAGVTSAAAASGDAAGAAATSATTTEAGKGVSIGDRFKGLTSRAKDTTKAQLEKADREVAVSAGTGPRKARVLVSRIDPWSSLKIGFLLSIAAGIMLVVAMHVLWSVLNGMGVFQLIQEWVSKLFTADQELNILQFFEYSKVMSATLLIAVVNVVLLTGLSVVATFLYNIISKVVGGVYVTLTDD